MMRNVWDVNAISELLLEQTDQGVLALDRDLRVVLCNRWLIGHIGISLDRLKGKPIAEVFPGIPQESVSLLTECLASGMPRVFSPILRKAPLLPLPMEHPYVRVVPLVDDVGETAGIILLVQDLSAQIGYEKDIKDRYTALVEASADHLFLLTPDGRFMASNDRVQRLGREKGEELLGKAVEEILPSSVAMSFQAAFNRVLKGEPKAAFEHTMEMEGRQRWCQSTLYPVEREGKLWAVGGSCRDITEQRDAEQELRQAQKMEAIGVLAGGVAHDFNNILSAVLGYAQLAMGEMDRTSYLYGYVEQIFKAGKRAEELVRQILTFSRQGQEEIRPLNAVPLVKETFKMLRASLPATVAIRLLLDKPRLIVAAEPTHIHQIIMNLSTNAAHAMDGEGTLEIGVDAVELDALEVEGIRPLPPPHSGPYVRLRVSDTGCGIPRECLDRIFDPYFTTKPEGKGTGLGLSVVWGIAKQLNGGIRVETEPGKGSVFEVWIPRLEGAADRHEREEDEREPIPGGTESILLVDDEPAILGISREFLSDLGYRVTTRANGPEALDLFRQGPGKFDLVVTDMAMPYMSGLQLGRSLREIRPDIPLILCTGFSEKVSKEKAAELGFNGYISKPILKRNLAETVRKALGSRPSSPCGPGRPG